MSVRKIIVVLAAVTALGAQQPPEAGKDDDFWFSTPRRQAAVAAQFVAAQNPLTLAAMRDKSLKEMVWGGLEGTGDTAPALNPDLLDAVRDHRPLPNLVGREEKELSKAEKAIYGAYNQALIYAFQYPAEAFKKSAKDHEHLKFAHLWNEPDIHRGKVVTVKGRLYRVRKYEAPQPAQEAGVKDLYEGWIFGETKGSHPFCVIFTVLPEGIPISEQMERHVTFQGYFLMRYKYRAQKGDLETPLLIGPTVHPVPRDTTEPTTPFPVYVLFAVAAILAAIVTGMVAISWWFRRGDSKIQSRISDLQNRRVEDALEDLPDDQPPPGNV